MELDYSQLAQWDKDYVWHPFTQMQMWNAADPLIIGRGEGSYLIDIQGNRYLDGISSLWVTVHGHAHPVLTQAIKDQVDKIAHTTLLGLANVPSIQLAKKLVEITPPGLTKVFYSDAGATSVEIALKIAFQYWQQQTDPQERQKKKFISLEEAYHGDTVGAVSVGGMDLFHATYRDLLFEGYKVPTPYCYRCPLGRERDQCNLACVQVVEDIMEEHHQEIAGMIIEPLVQGAAGMLTAPVGYLRKIRELCTKYNILMIADEVAVGFGRTGTLFACEQEGVSPDIMCIAKGLTGGYLPLAATLTTETIFQAFLGEPRECKTFFHGHTFTGNPVGCAVALANIEVIEQTRLIQHVQDLARMLSGKLEGFKSLSHVGDIRQKGLMVGIELVRDKQTKEPYTLEENIGHQVILEARRHGLIIRPLGNVLVLMPILAMSEEQLQQVLSITYQAIKNVTERES
ncbi:adenosylmethionine--8-amino-7-oxononanoate transaminase [Desulfosporosinus metallidurans]|uniref:Adenosylmethionine-8-amino-7-oxononanoate aminotransferase n=1 Tax=Desulfosporosinus metallidurans TaxID=1888891 RepID=A0A1Q8R338_9FIRM|nr:adenosylmethionine--8-amino-7-oxononanoate transaminase [Desulfosporosinus metallidurans]OLN34043.1 Adenosylmethionine-8-amino-7-oxononanoate aminotransferase [Desulfosporosinus metallidurans]